MKMKMMIEMVFGRTKVPFVNTSVMLGRFSKTSTPWFLHFFQIFSYRCTLRGVQSPSSDVRITTVSGNHLNDNEDRDVSKLWIVEQQATYIPNLSKIVTKFDRIRDFRIWSCGLKYLERSKLKAFKKIIVLDLFNNLIEEIPENTFDDLTNLEELIILRNRLQSLPETLLRKLNRLKYFRAQENEIETLPANFFDGTQIVEVVMSKNNLKKIAVNFNNYANINLIDFKNNDCINKCRGHSCEQISVDEMQKAIEMSCK